MKRVATTLTTLAILVAAVSAATGSGLAWGQAASDHKYIRYLVRGNNLYTKGIRYRVSHPVMRFQKDGVPYPYKIVHITLDVDNVGDRLIDRGLAWGSATHDLMAEIPESKLAGTCAELTKLDDPALVPRAHRAGWCALPVVGQTNVGNGDLPYATSARLDLTIEIGAFLQPSIRARDVRIYAQGVYVDPRDHCRLSGAQIRQAGKHCV
jgi:hypothetical protein